MEHHQKFLDFWIRPLLSLKRLAFDETEGKVSYQYGKDSSKQELMDYPEFILSFVQNILCEYIPSPNFFVLFDNHSFLMYKSETCQGQKSKQKTKRFIGLIPFSQ